MEEKSVKQLLSEANQLLKESEKPKSDAPPKEGSPEWNAALWGKIEQTMKKRTKYLRKELKYDPHHSEPRAFDIRTGRDWMAQARNKPVSKMLFSELWYEGEICILFADTNLGKSILAVQIAESIASGIPVPGFKLEAEKQKVLYFDFELSDTQFWRRYSGDNMQEYAFPDNFLRAELTSREYPEQYLNFESFIVHSIEREVNETGAKVLIVDNITYLRPDAERAKEASPFMQQLCEMKKRLGISLLVIAHTPKRDKALPLDTKDVAGSSMLTNFCDSIFGIGPSQHDKTVRYIKQMKLRNNEHLYHEDNVFVCRVEKPDNFLGFTFLNYGTERDHLKQRTDNDKSEMVAQVKALKEQGMSQREIANELGIGLGSVNRYLRD